MRDFQTRRLVVALVGGMVASASWAVAQVPPDQCATCHLATTELADFDHLLAWEESAHRRAGVGCESCHGGDPRAQDPREAHRDVLGSRNPASPVHRANLPGTCGSCHTAPAAAFRQSRHFELLTRFDPRGPTCQTCHGAVAAELLSPGGVERQCAACHGSDDPVAQRPQRARVALEQIYEARRDLTAARRASGGMQDAVTRLALEQLFQLAESSVVQGADSLHRFVFVEAEQHLREAHAHIDRLLARLVNPE